MPTGVVRISDISNSVAEINKESNFISFNNNNNGHNNIGMSCRGNDIAFPCVFIQANTTNTHIQLLVWRIPNDRAIERHRYVHGTPFAFSLIIKFKTNTKTLKTKQKQK